MKQIYRGLILLLLGLLLCAGSQAQGNLYRDLGNFTHVYGPNTKICINFYVYKDFNRNPNFSMYRYEYVLVGLSTSLNSGYLTSTWLYNARVYVNGNEVSYQQNPNGFTAYIRTTHTVLYHWYTNDEQINYTIKWGDSAYDPRNIR